MRTRLSSHPRSGIALVMTLVMTAVAIAIVAATLSRCYTVETLNARNNQYTAGIYAAEAATEKVVARMKADYLAGSLSTVTNNLALYRGYVPNVNENSYWNAYAFTDGQGHANQTYVQCISATGWGALQSQFSGLFGWTNTYRIVSNARQVNSSYAITNAVQQDLQLNGIPVFQFAIFYNELLEFTWCATFTINGRVHANSNIFVGSSANLTFNNTVTTTRTISSPAWFGKTGGSYTGTVTYNGNPGYSTNAQALTLPVGTNNSAAAVREIINLPASGEDPDSAVGEQRYYNKATVRLMVSNTTAMVTLTTGTDDLNPTNIVAYYNATNFTGINTNFPWLAITNTSFTDQREASKTVQASQIDIGVLKSWLVTNNAVNAKFPNVNGVYNNSRYPNILYVADNRTLASNQLAAVRLMDASIVPTNMSPSGQPTGFTVATINPLYVWGDYNCPNASAKGTTNTAQTYPCSLISDSLTILSSAWRDGLSAGGYSSRDPVDTTINAAILTGIVFSTGSDVNSFSGGVQNLPRLLEDWQGAGRTLTLNTSIVNLFNSVRATNQFQQPGVYYSAPTRKFSFDMNFVNQSKLPPGTPILGVIQRSKWCNPPPGTVTYAGN